LKVINTNLFTNYSKSLETLQPDPSQIKSEDYINRDLLKTIFSDFEEVRERQRFLKYDLIWQRAEAAFESSQKASHL
jgi:hypothetical protein